MGMGFSRHPRGFLFPFLLAERCRKPSNQFLKLFSERFSSSPINCCAYIHVYFCQALCWWWRWRLRGQLVSTLQMRKGKVGCPVCEITVFGVGGGRRPKGRVRDWLLLSLWSQLKIAPNWSLQCYMFAWRRLAAHFSLCGSNKAGEKITPRHHTQEERKRKRKHELVVVLSLSTSVGLVNDANDTYYIFLLFLLFQIVDKYWNGASRCNYRPKRWKPCLQSFKTLRRTTETRRESIMCVKKRSNTSKPRAKSATSKLKRKEMTKILFFFLFLKMFFFLLFHSSNSLLLLDFGNLIL